MAGDTARAAAEWGGVRAAGQRASDLELALRAELVARATALIPMLGANAGATDLERRVVEQNILAMTQAGLFRMMVPRRYGGYQVNMRTFLDVISPIAEGCGAAGLLQGKRATTHWGAFSLLKYFGATPVNERVVVDGKLITAAGVTAGIDGALAVAARFRGDQVAQEIQLGIEYAPQPPFHSGTLDQAPPVVLKSVQGKIADLSARRLTTAQRLAKNFGSSGR